MSDEFDPGDKTEQPTQRRRQEVRARGQVARSGDLSSAALLLTGIGALYFLGSDVVAVLARIMQAGLSARPHSGLDTGALAADIRDLTGEVAGALLPFLGLLVLSGVAINLAQVGFLATAEPLWPDVARLNPAAGLRRIFSWHTTGLLAGSLLKLAVVAAIVAGFVAARLPELLTAGALEPGPLCRQVGSWIVALGLQLAIGLAVLAMLDYGFQLWRFEQGLKMTRQELLDELRHTEGDPQVRKRRGEVHRRIAASGKRAEPIS